MNILYHIVLRYGKTPLISVIVPVYNVAAYLEDCLYSIVNQSYKNIEIICIDDFSEDNSYEILKKYEKTDQRIKVLKNDKNIGLGLTRNVGLSLAKGYWIHFVDPDDWLELDAYEKIIQRLENYDFIPDLMFFECNMYYPHNDTYKRIAYPNRSILDKNLKSMI